MGECNERKEKKQEGQEEKNERLKTKSGENSVYIYITYSDRKARR